MFNLSICVTTYNRAELLRQCLDYLASFSNREFELLIGNNASTDDTLGVIESFRDRFPYLIVLTQKENIGPSRNCDSLVRRATRKYVYTVCDDDLVFEGALRMAMLIMEGTPSVTAVSGQYIGVQSVDPNMQVDFGDTVASVLKQGAYGVLFDNLNICDGFPVLRREIYERHCSIPERAGALVPLFFTLLNHGDLVVLDKPFIQHRTTTDSMSGNLAEAWFLDMANADLELVTAQYGDFLPPGSLQRGRQRLLQLLYLQSARMSLNRNLPQFLWLFLRRLIAVEGAAEEMLLKCEYHFSHDFLVTRIAEHLKISLFERVHFANSETVKAVVATVATRLPSVQFVVCDPDDVACEGDLLICDRFPGGEIRERFKRVIALDDFFEQVRLTKRDGALMAIQSRIFVQYSEQDALAKLLEPSPAFNIVCAPYSDIS